MESKQKFEAKLKISEEGITPSIEITSTETGNFKPGKVIRGILAFLLIATSSLFNHHDKKDDTLRDNKKSTCRPVQLNKISSEPGEHVLHEFPDGTKIWLYGKSSIKYPVMSEGDSFKVELEGEAYFEVAKKEDGRPFIVQTRDQTIYVLGTQFKVNTSRDRTTTTLVEGSIRLIAGKKEMTLVPGQRTILHKEDISLETFASPEEAASWSKEDFRIHKLPVSSILKKLEAWYGLSFQIEEDLNNTPYTVTWPKNAPISVALERLESVCPARFLNKNKTFEKGDTIQVRCDDM